ncbi:MAG: hypothetical protein RLW61_14690 [Gammaproteobacteria bacterium]
MTSRLPRLSALLVLPMLLSGCLLNTQDIRVSAEHKTAVKTVGVVSLLPVRINVSALGSSALESDLGHVTVAGWNPERVVAEVLVPRFERAGFATRLVAPDEALAAARAADWRAPLANSIAQDAYAAGAAAGVDMLVVVQSQVGEDFVTDTNQNVRGYGVQRAFDTAPQAYATVLVEAFDVDRRFVVGRAEAQQSAAAADGAWHPAFDTIDGSVALDAAGGAALTEQLATMLRTTIAVAAQEAGL